MHSVGYFRGLNDFLLHYQCWTPPAGPHAILLVAHGFAEHSGRYGNLVDYFVPRGWAVCVPDHRGHGRSDGARAQVDSFSDYVDDFKTFLDIMLKQYPGKKVFLVGHSMGSAIAVLFASRFQDHLAGLVTSGGGMSRPDEPPPPPAPSGRPLDTEFLSRDPEVIKAYVNDPLVYRGPIPVNSGISGMRSAVSAAAPQVKLPALIMAGNAVADGPRSRVLFDFLASEDKTLKLYDGLRHEIFNEPEHPQVLADLSAWLDSHLASVPLP